LRTSIIHRENALWDFARIFPLQDAGGSWHLRSGASVGRSIDPTSYPTTISHACARRREPSVARRTLAPSTERPSEARRAIQASCAFLLSGYDPCGFGSAVFVSEDHRVLKKFLIPVFAFAAAAIGCTGGSNDVSVHEAGTAGSDGSTAVVDGSMTGVNSAAAGPDVSCTLETFCPIYLAYCGTTTPSYSTLAECTTTFTALGTANPYKQQCQSYHLCLAIYDTGSDRVLHCSHAAGGGNQCGF
jgi:hypothetical protein